MAKTSFVIVDMFDNEHGVVAKLQQKSTASLTVEGLGTQVRTKQLTYYYPCQLSQTAIDCQSLIGNVVSLDPDIFDIREKEMPIPSENKTITTKWLFTPVK